MILKYLDRTTSGTIHIVDDEFSTNPRRVIEIAEKIKERNLSPHLVFDCRATDILHEGFVENLDGLTFQFLVGAESGYDGRSQTHRKGHYLQGIKNAAAKLKEHGISDRADFSFILGLPWEMKADVERTIGFAAHLHGSYGVRTLLQWYCQIPGSRQWEEDRSNQVVNEAMYDRFGFFRDLYLFRSGVQLSPSDIWEITDLLIKLQWLSSLRYQDNPMIEFGIPQQIIENFPKNSISETDSGLFSLRQVSRPSVEAEISVQKI